MTGGGSVDYNEMLRRYQGKEKGWACPPFLFSADKLKAAGESVT
jgi:hypothetical protein